MAPKLPLKSVSKPSISNPGKKRAAPSAESPSKTKSIMKAAKEPKADADVPEDEGSDPEDDEHLYGFSTDEDDSSDEDDAVGEEVDIGKLPTVAKDDATVKKKLEKAKRHPVSSSTSYIDKFTPNYEAGSGPRCDIYGSPTTWVLRRSTAGISFSIRGCDKIANLAE